MPLDAILPLIPALNCTALHSSQVVGSDSELGGPSYMVNMEGLVRMLQRRTIFSIASERFGFVSARIVGESVLPL